MNRLLLLSAAAVPLLADASLKSAALLLLAGVCALFMRRASAAARHMVWLAAVLALLLVPVLSVVLPGWRVLPQWAAVEAGTKETERTPEPVAAMPAALPPVFSSEVVSPPDSSLPSFESSVSLPLPEASPVPRASAPVPEAPAPTPLPVNAWLLPIWAAGCVLLLVRLAAAHYLLRRATRRCETTTGPLAAAFAAAVAETGHRQPVRLLMDRQRTIPVVWGLFRPRLLLPAEAATWPDSQLRSVLLHELAHLRRRDPLVQFLAQLACALHWFNPLVWLAAWRLHVERERACDDLVLASGVRPSAYAEHLLHIATQLSPARWTQACGLAMARKSSLEGRLLAVLSDKLNRRRLTRALTAAAILLSAAIAVPIAMLRAAPAADKKDQPSQSGASVPSPTVPAHKEARALYDIWQRHARTNGDIPGALIGELAIGVRRFIHYNPTWETVPKLNEILARLDATRDWQPADATALLDEVAAVKDSPIDMALSDENDRVMTPGQPLPKELADKLWIWSPADASGLRIGWDLEPRGEPALMTSKEENWISSHALGTALGARLFVHNTGDKPVVVRVPTFHQGGVTAANKDAAEIEVSGIEWTTLARLVTHRLAPGEYVAIRAPGVGFGKDAGRGPWAGPRVGWNVMAQPGDWVRLTHAPLACDASHIGRREVDPIEDGPAWWTEFVKARLARGLTAPAEKSDAITLPEPADRAQLLDSACLDLFGTGPTDAERTAFDAVKSRATLFIFAEKLAQRPGITSFDGTLAPRHAWFEMQKPDPTAAGRPRVVLGPGEYPIGEGTASLKIVGRPVGDRRTNDAQLVFVSKEPGIPRASTHKLELPDGWGAWAIVCRPGEGFFYVLHKGGARKIDYTKPREVTDTPATDLPAEFRDEVKRQLDVHEISAESQAEVFEKPSPPADGKAAAGGAEAKPPEQAHLWKPGAKLDPNTEAQLDWGEAVNGLRGAVVIRGEPQGIYLAVQNVSPTPLRLTDTVKAKDLRKFYPSDAKGILFAFTSDEPTQTDVLLQPREVAYLRMMPPLKEGEHSPEAGLIEGIRKDALQTWAMVLQIAAAPEGAWKGKLITADTRCALREGGPQPKNASAQALFKHWQSNARLNGDIPSGLVRLLHEKVKDFIRANEPDASGGPFAQKMKPLEPRFANAGDWKAADVVALLDDIAAAHTIPLDNALTHLTERTLYPGTPLPASLEKADWGEPLPSGLRVAHLLEPRAGAYHLGTELKARIIFHNTGSQHVEFITDTFQQPGHSAKRADGSDIKLDATDWLTRGSMAAYRLAPGEYCEVHTPGLGIGAQVKGREDWENVRAGSWILCAEGDEVVVTPGAAALSYHETPEQKADWWLEFITERLNREAPVPTDTKEREYLLYRVVRELFGTAPSTTEGDAFAADKSPDALKNLAALLAKHPYGKQSDGVIRAGSTKFRVLPPDADADKRPRVATGAGMFSLGDGVNFYVTQRPVSNSVRNDASIVYYQQGKDAVVHKVPLPYGHDKWAAATMKGAKELWVAEFGTLRKYDFTNPLLPSETRYEAGKLSDAPISKELRAALDPVLSKAAVAPKPKPSGPPPASAPATEKP